MDVYKGRAMEQNHGFKTLPELYPFNGTKVENTSIVPVDARGPQGGSAVISRY